MGSATTTPATIWCLPLKLLDVGLLPVQTKWRCQPFHNLDLALAPGARLPTAFEHDRIAIMSAQISAERVLEHAAATSMAADGLHRFARDGTRFGLVAPNETVH